MNRKKKFLTAAVLCTLASTGFVMQVSAEETLTHDLDEVIVEEDRDALPGGYVSTKGTSGLLGSNNVMDVPFTQMNLTAKNIEDYGDPTLA